ncbi:hypothetical protein F9C28_18215 [Shimwellia pseudoproteus]|uniref:hypothetical protein n=1 Tax=Shimwellia pseudoproteus TaxID=570012 RepID=UPI0018EAED38|nr:hypothetical protein [Shimwellia pseudoproteus]MBJ3816786.1 hypothetical protein [Shimwellia pseudoproteus]
MRRRAVSRMAGGTRLHLAYRQCTLCGRTAWFQLYNDTHELLDRGTPAYRWFTEATGHVLVDEETISPQRKTKNAPAPPVVTDNSDIIYTGAFIFASLIVAGLLIIIVGVICGWF